MARLTALVVAGGLVGATIVVGIPVVDGDSSRTNIEWFGHLGAALMLLVFTGLLVPLGVQLKGLVVGKDNRLSTGRLQALIWTYAIGWALLSLIVADWAGSGAGFEALLDEELKDEYLLLLGGPFAAAVAARAIVGQKVDHGQVVKTEGAPRLNQAVSDDSGDADLVDFQYIVFNLIALTYFVGAFVDDPSGALPNVPDVLIGLTGVAAATYVANKAVLSEGPRLTRIVPSTVGVGQQVELFGSLLRLPRLEDGTTVYEEVTVTFDDTVANVVTSSSTPGGDDRITVTVPSIPGASGETSVDVRAYNARGMASDPYRITVRA